MFWTCYRIRYWITDICHKICLEVNIQFRSVILATILNKEYGNQLVISFCKPADIQLDIKLMPNSKLPFLQLDKASLISNQLLSSACIKYIFIQIHPSQRPLVVNFFKESPSTLTSAFYECEKNIMSILWNFTCSINIKSLSLQYYCYIIMENYGLRHFTLWVWWCILSFFY